MNEITELSLLRADVATGDQQRLAGAEALLHAEIRASRERDVPSLIRSPRTRRPRRYATALPGARRSLRPRLVAGAAAAVAAAAVVAAAVTAGLLAGPGQPTASSRSRTGMYNTVAYVLSRAAAASAATRGPGPGPGQYVSMSSVTTELSAQGGTDGQITRSWLTTSSRRIWLSGSGTIPGALQIQQQGAQQLPWGGAPPARWGRRLLWMSVPAAACPARTRGTYPYLVSLPTDRTKLRAWIYAHLGGGKLPVAGQAWKEIASLLGTMPVPPKLAAALFHVAATIPGTTVVRHATDAAGRSGVAVGRLDGASHADVELIFDRTSYRFLGERSVLAAPVAGVGPAGTMISSTAQLSLTVTDHLPAQAPASARAAGPASPSATC